MHSGPSNREEISALTANEIAYIRLRLQSFPFPPHVLVLYSSFIHFPFCSTAYLFSFFVQHKYKGEVVLTHVVLFAVCTSLQLLQVCFLTNPMARLVSLSACSPERSMGITVNALSCFCRVVECLLLMDTPVACFLRCQTRALSPAPSGTAFRSQAVQSDQSYCPQNQSASFSTKW